MDVRVYVADGCHLCGPAVEVVRSVCGEDFELVDITDVPELERRYRAVIPLVEVDGEERFRYELTADDLRDALAAADRPGA
jgi:hypothetical protein